MMTVKGPWSSKEVFKFSWNISRGRWNFRFTFVVRYVKDNAVGVCLDDINLSWDTLTSSNPCSLKHIMTDLPSAANPTAIYIFFDIIILCIPTMYINFQSIIEGNSWGVYLHTWENSDQLSFWLFFSDIQYPITRFGSRLERSILELLNLRNEAESEGALKAKIWLGERIYNRRGQIRGLAGLGDDPSNRNAVRGRWNSVKELRLRVEIQKQRPWHTTHSEHTLLLSGTHPHNTLCKQIYSTMSELQTGLPTVRTPTQLNSTVFLVSRTQLRTRTEERRITYRAFPNQRFPNTSESTPATSTAPYHSMLA